MPRTTDGLAFLYSGGPANVNASASIGGLASTAVERYVDSQSFTASTIPGITITHAARNAAGTGTLSYYASSRLVVWLTSAGALSSVTVAADGWYALGYTGGFIRVYVNYGLLPVFDSFQSVTISEAEGTIFGSPTAPELLSGMTDYRCVYLVNELAVALTSIVLTLTDNAAESSISLGSIYDPVSQYTTPSSVIQSMYLHAPTTTTPPCVHGVDGRTYREGLKLTTSAGFPYFPCFPTDTVNSSNGIDEFVPPLLVDKYDSTGLLSNVVWGNTISWPYIPAGRMVSMYFRRIMPANPPIPTNESMDIDMLVILI